jgi:ribonuclease VapC
MWRQRYFGGDEDVIVIDTSAIVAIWENEPEAEILKSRLTDEAETERRVSAATYVEAGTVLAGRRWPEPLGALDELDHWIERFRLELVPVDAEQARIALNARIRFGRGFRVSAKLNYGDCFSYALAKTLNAPLLYIGDDFDRTDVRSALPRKRKPRK